MRLSNQDVASSVLGTQGSHCQEQPLFPISYLAILIFNWWHLPKASGYFYLLPEDFIFCSVKGFKNTHGGWESFGACFNHQHTIPESQMHTSRAS